MARRLKIFDENTGEILEDVGFSGGYNIQYADNEDSGRIKKIIKLDNAKYGDKCWIKNLMYRPIAEKLVEKFEELEHINPRRILFIEDNSYSPKPGKRDWIARTKAANNDMYSMTGYEYIIETRECYTSELSHEQIVALIYHELRHIDKDGKIIKHDIEDWGNMVATLGHDWAETKAMIADILDEEFEWGKVRNPKQVSMFGDNLIQMRAAK